MRERPLPYIPASGLTLTWWAGLKLTRLELNKEGAMSTLAELAERAELTPSELKRFGARVLLFEFNLLKGEDFVEAKKRLFGEIEGCIKANGGQLYTGIHSERDWSRERWWSRGAHLVNRTLNFAIIVPKN